MTAEADLLPIASGMSPILGHIRRLIANEEEDAYPFPFHPLDLGEAALKDRFGYQLEGYIDASLLEPELIPLVRYKRIRSSWSKFW